MLFEKYFWFDVNFFVRWFCSWLFSGVVDYIRVF